MDAIRSARYNAQYEIYDLVSYVCGRHPKHNSVWLPTKKPHESYKANRRLEAVETHLYGVKTLIHEVYSSKQPTENAKQPDQTQKDEAMAQPSRETLNLPLKLR